jgi:hypothetical protein
VQGPFDRPGDDLGIAMVAVGVADQVADEKRPIHHEAVHDSLLAK